jgi:tRNA 2-thiouridine synthesizing protein A
MPVQDAAMKGREPECFDLRGLKCPMPALIARRRLSRSATGTIIVVMTDDPMAPIDVPHMCNTEGFEVLAVERNGDEARMTLRRPAPPSVVD